MRKFTTLLGKELGQFFSTPTFYAILAVFIGVSGFFFYNIARYFANYCMFTLQYKFQGFNVPLNVNQWVVRPFFINLAVVALFLIPIITMRSYAAERAYGTAELLLTAPIKTSQLVLSKLVGGLILFIVLISTTILFQLILDHYAVGGLDWGPVWAGYLGLLLIGFATIPLGQFISTLTKNQIIAAFLTFAFMLILWIVDWSTLFSQTKLAKIVGYIGMAPHFNNFAKGVIDTSDVIYFISAGVLGIFLTYQSVESWRWRGA